jgi:hypothetical protein
MEIDSLNEEITGIGRDIQKLILQKST